MRGAGVFVADFETTTFEGQQSTEVWAAALCEVGSTYVNISDSIYKFWREVNRIEGNLIIFFHNLRFDGSFLLNFFLSNNWKQGFTYDQKKNINGFKPISEMENGELCYTISDKGQWYSIRVKNKNRIVDFRDSLKLLPFSVEEIAKAFSTRKVKGSIDYSKHRGAGEEITPEERDYIANDVLIVAEAMQHLRANGYEKNTIGSCCLEDYKTMVGDYNFTVLFPRLDEIKIDESVYGSKDADSYIRKAYRGGWCYCDERVRGKIIKNGITLDVNSLYPSVMHSRSRNAYPFGKPNFWVGEMPKLCDFPFIWYVVRIKCRFNLKRNHLPTVQIKRDLRYDGTEWLKTSDLYDRDTGEYFCYYEGENGEKIKNLVTLTLTKTDFELFMSHYNVYDLEVLDGCYFTAKTGLFDAYINKHYEIKRTSKGAKRQLAKLSLNNLYGQLAKSRDSSFRVARLSDEGLKFENIFAQNKTPVHIACGCAVTAYARYFEISHCQLNYDHFCYADTDSAHLCCGVDEIKGIVIDPSEMLCWDLEKEWNEGLFVRQKTYIEKNQNGVTITCAGLNKRGKELFGKCLGVNEDCEPETEEEKAFLSKRREITDFESGLKIPSKLRPKQIRGGVVLERTEFTIRN